MHKPALPSFVSETLPPQAWEREDIFRLIYEGERNVEPLAIRNGVFYHPQGAYQLFATPEGARVGLWASDPDDLVVEEKRTLTADEAKGRFRFDENNKKVPLQEGDVLPNRLKDLGNGNLDRLRVFTLKSRYNPRHWLRDEMNSHQAAFRNFTLVQGTLVRESPTHWTSGGIVYQLVPAKLKKTKAQKAYTPLVLDRPVDEPKYDLLMTQAPGFGWSLGEQFNRLYKKGSLTNIFMCAASVRARDLTMKQAETLVIRDFERRAPLFIDGKSPYDTPLVFAHARRSAWMRNRHTRKTTHWKPLKIARRMLRKYHLRNWAVGFVYGMHQLSLREILKTTTKLAGASIVVGLVMRAMGIEVNTLLYLGRITTRTLSRTNERIGEYSHYKKEREEEGREKDKELEELYAKYSKGWNIRQLWGGRFARDRVLDLEGMDHKRLNMQKGFYERTWPMLPYELMVKNYIFSVLQGPPGSVATPFRVGKYGGIRIDEPNGLSVEYIPEREAAFARLDRSKIGRAALPDAIIAEFNKNPDIPFLKVGFHPDKGGLFMHPISEDDYRLNMQAIAQADFPPPHRRPDPSKIRLVPVEVKVEKKRGWIKDTLGLLFGVSAGETAGEVLEETVDHIAETAKEIAKEGPGHFRP